MQKQFFILAAAVLFLANQAAEAQQVNLKGYLIALSDCQANKKKDSDNPGNVRLERLHAYEMIARNATPGTHYQVRVPGAPETDRRWVAMSCGAYAPQSALIGPGPSPDDGDGSSPGLAPDSIEYVLAASWQPAFCATSAGQGKAECVSQTPDRFDATHFSIHGLWPDDLDDKQIFPCYCDRGAPVACGGSQARDTSIDLPAPVLADLTVAMPGVQSGLHLHEWPKHGSCYEDDKTGADAGATPEEYFTETMVLIEQLNGSAVQALFEAKIGEVVSRAEVEAAFDSAYGAGAADRVLIRCSNVGGERIITELWIGLMGDIGPGADFGDLIAAAPPTETSTNTSNCEGGRVVEVTAN
jgi:ribonuclease T2